MENRFVFRAFEERDVDFIFRCKNDVELNRMTVGTVGDFSYEDAVTWVHNCMKGDRPDLKFFAIGAKKEAGKIIGWVSLSNIDATNKSACFHSMVIADNRYKDGSAWIESHIFVLGYVFETLKLNRVYGTYLSDHAASEAITSVMFFVKEGVHRRAVFKNGKYNDVTFISLLSSEYFEHKEKGDYEYPAILRRLMNSMKKK